MIQRLPRLFVVFFLYLLAATTYAASDGFPRPEELERDVAFWRRIYSEVSTSGGLLHDPERLDVVYEVIKFPADLPPRQRSKRIDELKTKYGTILDRLATADESTLTEEERRVHDLWPKGTRRARFEQAAEEVRFQLGQADRFREGIVRAGAYRDYIAATFEKAGLPRELAALPHVESSFNTYAYSKVGAAGMWQFMRATGRRFMRIDGVVDERLDPYRSTQAAAKFLEQNYIVLGSWPLALTAYNHGTAGMRRAQEQMGTSDIAVIARKYQSRSFGFASRNFYVAFLAALEIDQDPEKFFGPVQRHPVDNSRVVELPNFIPVSRIAKALDLETDSLRRLNPSLLPGVWNGTRHVPKGFEFRVPAHVDATAALQRLGTAESFPAQVADSQHRVRSGESLSAIATRYGVNVATIAELNGLRRPYRINAGQVLTLPTKGGAPAVVAAATPSVTKATEAAKPTTPPTGVVGENRYVVRRGDTLTRIAIRNGMSEATLMELNNIKNRNFVYEGQVLALAASARVAPPAESQVPVENIVPIPAEPVSVAEASEPVSEREAEELGPTLVPGIQAANSADPSDYSVHEDGSVRVQAAETLGHYAEWLEVRAGQIRKLNRMTMATPVVIGRKVKLDFSKISQDQFEARRQEYHKQLQESFFAQFRISGNETHVIKAGESIWVLAQQRYNIPIWLLRQYNPDLDLGSVKQGTKLVIPTVQSTAAPEPTG
ncbi:MAG TPA: LysM peptidoglycan-binding domain-containing protein [Steroidobacteraceae bacterium]|nr:LysM peptidoglycan-binding domain-containing protein [Steroidobacteraceae bacterium]